MKIVKKINKKALCGLLIISILPANSQAGGNFIEGWGINSLQFQPTFYGGASVGTAKAKDLEHDIHITGKLYGGTRLNRYMGLETGFMLFGDQESTGLNEPDGRLEAEITDSLSAAYLAGTIYVPVAHRVDITGKAGVMRWQQTQEKYIPLIDEYSSEKTNGTSPLIGLGVQYQLNDNLFLRGEWERATKVAKNTENETRIDMLSIGMHFSTW